MKLKTFKFKALLKHPKGAEKTVEFEVKAADSETAKRLAKHAAYYKCQSPAWEPHKVEEVA